MMKNISTIISESRQETEFIMIKPGFLQLIPTIKAKMAEVGLIPVRWNMKTLTYKEACKFYEPHKDEDFYPELCKYMQESASFGMLCINTKNIDVSNFKDKIRKEYGISDMRNVMHSSDSPERKRIEKGIYNL